MTKFGGIRTGGGGLNNFGKIAKTPVAMTQIFDVQTCQISFGEHAKTLTT